MRDAPGSKKSERKRRPQTDAILNAGCLRRQSGKTEEILSATHRRVSFHSMIAFTNGRRRTDRPLPSPDGEGLSLALCCWVCGSNDALLVAQIIDVGALGSSAAHGLRSSFSMPLT